MTVKRLVLFDIDETMISSDGAGRRSIAKVLKEHYGVPEEAMGISMSGKTDPQILREIFENCGKGGLFEDHTENILELYLGVLQEEIDNCRYYFVHQGIVPLLEALLSDESAYVGILTGNIERGARMKLEYVGLHKYFEVGAYGSDSANRLDLPEIAAKRASHHFKKDFAADEIVIIGDAINDVLCAKHYGAKSIAVNTGRTTWDELLRLEPDYLFKNLEDTQQVIQAIFADHPAPSRRTQTI